METAGTRIFHIKLKCRYDMYALHVFKYMESQCKEKKAMMTKYGHGYGNRRYDTAILKM